MMYNCLRCDYTWVARSDYPARCPHCKSTRWDKKVIIDKCQRCKAEWIQRGLEAPKYCPMCHSSMWDAKKKTYTCPKCGVTRTLRSNSRSGRCPTCDNYTNRRPRAHKEEYSGISNLVHLWGDGKGLTLNYLNNGQGKAYLYDGGKIVGDIDLDMLFTSQGLHFNPESASDESFQPIYEQAVKRIRDTPAIPQERVETVSALHRVDETTSKIMLFRESGMQPAVIALKLNVPFSYVMDVLTSTPRIARGNDLRINGPEASVKDKDTYTQKEKEWT